MLSETLQAFAAAAAAALRFKTFLHMATWIPGRAWNSTSSKFKITPGNVLERLKTGLQMSRNCGIKNPEKVFN